jgi:hypothetical protein
MSKDKITFEDGPNLTKVFLNGWLIGIVTLFPSDGLWHYKPNGGEFSQKFGSRNAAKISLGGS